MKTEKLAPKFCTNIDIAVLDNENLLLTMSYKEGIDSIIIERIMIDLEHTKRLQKLLTEILNNVENDKFDKDFME